MFKEITTEKKMNCFDSVFSSLNIFEGLLICALTFAIGARGSLPQLYVEGAIWSVAFYFAFKDRFASKVKLSRNTWISLVILFFYLAFNVVLNDTKDIVSFFYYYILIIPFYFVFNSYDRCKLFVITSGLMAIVVCVQLLLLYFFGFSQFQDIVLRRSGGLRAIGYMGNPNYFGYYCFVIFLLTQQFMFVLKNLVNIALLILVVFSISRGVLIGVCIYLILVIFKSVRNMFAAIICLFFIYNYVEVLLPENFARMFVNRLSELDSDNAGSGRSIIWSQGLLVWSENWQDVLFGFGFNNFQNRLNFKGVENTVHNSYLRMLFEFGFVGFFLMMGFFITAFKNIKWTSYREALNYGLPVVIVWLTNDFFINKETFILIAILSTIYFYKAEVKFKDSNERER